MHRQSEVQFETAADLRISTYSLLPKEKQRSTVRRQVRLGKVVIWSRPDLNFLPSFQLTDEIPCDTSCDAGIGTRSQNGGLGAVVVRRVSALFVSDLTGVVDGGKDVFLRPRYWRLAPLRMGALSSGCDGAKRGHLGSWSILIMVGVDP